MDLSLIFPLLLLLLFIPLFLQMRKQRRQMTEMQELQSSLAEGDVVVTIAGVRGTVVDASYEDTIDLEIADGVVTTWVRGAIRQKVEEPAEEGEPTAEVEEAPAASTDAGPSLEKNTDTANGATRS